MKKILLVLVLSFIALGSYAQSLEFLNISSDPYSYSMGGNTLTLDANSFTVTNNASAMAYAEDNMYASADTACRWRRCGRPGSCPCTAGGPS